MELLNGIAKIAFLLNADYHGMLNRAFINVIYSLVRRRFFVEDDLKGWIAWRFASNFKRAVDFKVAAGPGVVWIGKRYYRAGWSAIATSVFHRDVSIREVSLPVHWEPFKFAIFARLSGCESLS